VRAEDRYNSLFQFYGWKSGADWLLLKAQAQQESNLDPEAVSPAGAKGVAQFMPATFEEWAKKLGIKNPQRNNPEHSIQCQAAYLEWLLGRCNGQRNRALAAYNWGIGNMQPFAGSDTWVQRVPQETRIYLRRIEKLYQILKLEERNAA